MRVFVYVVHWGSWSGVCGVFSTRLGAQAYIHAQDAGERRWLSITEFVMDAGV